MFSLTSLLAEAMILFKELITLSLEFGALILHTPNPSQEGNLVELPCQEGTLVELSLSKWYLV